MDRPTTIDLFAGAGGLSWGLQQAGFSVQLAVEQDKWAAETFAANFPEASVCVADIDDFFDSSEFKKLYHKPDLIVGGPPCQGFSHSNVVNKDARDPRNSLFKSFLRWICWFKPKFFLIENVTGLLSTRTESGDLVIDLISSSIREIGYECQWKILQAADYGVPQRRSRLFIVGARSKELMKHFHWPAPAPDHPVTLWEAIADLPEEGGQYASPPTSEFQGAMRMNFTEQLPTAHEPMRHTPRIIERFRAIGYGEGEASAKAQKPIRRGGGGEGRAYAQNSRRQRPDLPCNTIVASSHTNFIHPFFHRNFTVRELMRIQSFPDDFVVRGKRAVLSRKLSLRKGLLDEIYLDQRMQIGNAVPPLLSKAIGQQFKLALEVSMEIPDAA